MLQMQLTDSTPELIKEGGCTHVLSKNANTIYDIISGKGRDILQLFSLSTNTETLQGAQAYSTVSSLCHKDARTLPTLSSTLPQAAVPSVKTVSFYVENCS